jgi:hypothetical protein
LTFVKKNDCCSGSVVFSPHHRVGIYTTIILCVAAYFYSYFRQRPASPVIDLCNHAVLVLGVCRLHFALLPAHPFYRRMVLPLVPCASYTTYPSV